MTVGAMHHRFLLGDHPRLHGAYERRRAALSEVADIDVTLVAIRKIQEKRNNPYQIRTESADVGSDGAIDPSSITTFQNMVDVVGEEVDEKSAGNTTNSDQGQRNMLDMGDFLSRPIPISNFQIAVGASTSVRLSVWDLFTLDPSIRAKLRNYAYLRGNLHVRVAISGTPFHYGRLMVSYQPVPLKNAALVRQIDNLTLEPNFWRFAFLNYQSQAPGATTVDVRDNQPVDMICPYISTKPMHRLFNSSAAAMADTTSYADIENAGDIFIYSVAPLGCINATPSDVSVYVYAWMTEVELGTSTATQIQITTESKDIDERVTGPVEKYATRLASYASVMTAIPVIEPFAAASAIALNGIAGVASIFGWSKPVMIESPPVLVKNMGFQNGAQTIGFDTNYRITLDPKQELTVDPRVLGDGEDEMVINHITAVESLLTTFSWNDDSPIMQTPIWSCLNIPTLNTTFTNLAALYVQPTALSYAALPFDYWRGTITYRLDIICSQFHRGKLAVFFEPNVNQAVLINAALATNKQYIKVIDIQETQSIEFDVNWAFPRAWARVPTTTESLNAFGSTFSVTGMEQFANGYIGVTPLTTLQSPDDSDISINVFVSSSDMQFNFLHQNKLPTERGIITESRDVTFSKEVTCLDLNESSAVMDHICEEHFGERPISFRSLLKRYTSTVKRETVANPTASKIIYANVPIMPPIDPSYGDPISTGNPTLWSYLRYAYVGMRGGVRKRLHVRGLLEDGISLHHKVNLASVSSSDNIVFSTNTDDSILSLLAGSVTFVPHSNGGIEVELPFYSSNLYHYSFAEDGMGPAATGSDELEWVKRYTYSLESNTASGALVFVEDSASAEDFSFMRFQGAPYFSISV